jgi:carboxypeptidase C (cathepsin A)
MTKLFRAFVSASLLPLALAAQTQSAAPVSAPAQSANSSGSASGGAELKPFAIKTTGSMTTASGVVACEAVTGTLVVQPKGWDDAAPPDKSKPSAAATMSYVAYFKSGADATKRPLTFVFNGGPGSATLWLHMGAFGPGRVVTNDHTHTSGAPYEMVENDQSLLDVSDLVFIDMPGTGLGHRFG